jgi:hypothetical protein
MRVVFLSRAVKRLMHRSKQLHSITLSARTSNKVAGEAEGSRTALLTHSLCTGCGTAPAE